MFKEVNWFKKGDLKCVEKVMGENVPTDVMDQNDLINNKDIIKKIFKKRWI